VTEPGQPVAPVVRTRLAADLDRNDRRLRELLDAHSADPEAVRCALFARCWPNDANRRPDVLLHLNAGESLDQARERHGIRWNPQWLLEAGYTVADVNGVVLTTVADAATAAGPVSWTPEVLLPRVDDKAPADLEATCATARAGVAAGHRRREPQVLAGEVALAALWSESAFSVGMTTNDIDDALSRQAQAGANARGARWNGGMAYYLELRLAGWRVETQVSIRDVFGLHLRSDVVQRKADAVVVTPGGKVMAFVSAKFSWRSDRGTEAAQMVFLQRYRPDLPYVLVTAEFPRALTEIGTESIEDQAFHLSGPWVGAWAVTQELPDAGSALPSLVELRDAGRDRVPPNTLLGLDNLVEALGTAAQYL
jgi:hypothetical protein